MEQRATTRESRSSPITGWFAESLEPHGSQTSLRLAVSQLFKLISELLLTTSLQAGEEEFNWWKQLFNTTDSSVAHSILFAKDEDEDGSPDESQIVKIYRYYDSQPENPYYIDPDDYLGNESLIRDIQKSIAKVYYQTVVTGGYGEYAGSLVHSTANNDTYQTRNATMFREYADRQYRV